MCNHRYSFTILFLIILLFPSKAISATFTVNPIKLFFGAGKKTDIITITNNSEEKLSMQVSALLWDQDDEGMRLLSPSTDLVVFPKLFTIEKGENRLVRVGIKVPPGQEERPYRLYFEELPMPREEKGGASLRTLLKVGISVYLTPLELKRSANIEDIRLSKGKLAFKVTNSGNAHIDLKSIEIEGIDGSGATLFTREVGAKTVLAGRSKPFSQELSKETCAGIGQIRINVLTGYPLEMISSRHSTPLSMSEKFDVLPTMCAP
jgi:fimbrial chaperone protein